MRIYILRHEDRTQDATMFSPLTEEGLENSIKLIDDLEDLDINKIYSSPFIRTLQTIYPYANKNDLEINIDYSLAEYQNPYLIPKKSWSVSLPNYLEKQFKYNPDYKSLMSPTEYNYPEKVDDVKKRVRAFLQSVFIDNKGKKNNILIVGHQIVCNAILDLVAKKGKTSLDKDFDMENKYPRGGVTLVFHREWDYKPINF
jgi:broad specificity phosphatase PhoE